MGYLLWHLAMTTNCRGRSDHVVSQYNYIEGFVCVPWVPWTLFGQRPWRPNVSPRRALLLSLKAVTEYMSKTSQSSHAPSDS